MMNNKKKNKGSSGIIVAVAVYFIVAMINGAMESSAGAALIIFAIIIAIIVGVVVLVVKVAKASTGQSRIEHSHDRLTPNTLKAEDANSFEHYKRQLDSFLTAGIIDKSEYRTLYEKYRKTLK